jgi:two-component system response regulator MprA
MPLANLLVVEDDADLRRILRRGLEEEGFAVEAVGRGDEALIAAGRNAPAVMVLDIGLPDADGRDVCQALRAQGIDAPVIFLTARDAVSDRISGFTAGGDDYLTKPFELGELIVRIRAILRRSVADPSTVVHDLRLDPSTHAVECGDATLPLTPTEFRLLAALAARPGNATRRRELVGVAWPDGAIVHDNTLDVYIARLRRKLRDLGSEAQIETVHGVGYKLT